MELSCKHLYIFLLWETLPCSFRTTLIYCILTSNPFRCKQLVCNVLQRFNEVLTFKRTILTLRLPENQLFFGYYLSGLQRDLKK